MSSDEFNYMDRDSGAVSRVEGSRHSSIATTVLISIVIFILSGVAVNMVLKDTASQLIFRGAISEAKKVLEYKICPSSFHWLNKQFCSVDEGSMILRQSLAKLPNSQVAFSTVAWAGKSEQDAVKYAATISAIAAADWKDYDLPERWSITREALKPIWKEYPRLALASRCYYCSYHASNLYEWNTEYPNLHKKSLIDVVEMTPHQLKNFHEQLNIKNEELLNLVRLHSRLAHLGNREYFHTKILSQHNDDDHTLSLIKNTSSAAPYWKVDLTQMPQALVKLAWEQGVRHLDDHPKFTRHMVSIGHKPALRWLVWYLAEVNHSPELSRLKSHKNAYQAILNEYVSGELNAEIYSEKWQQIRWDKSKKQWLY